MTQEEIMRMAEQAGMFTHKEVQPEIQAFAKLVAAKEREACAYRAGIALLGADRGLANRVDQAIRARGETK